MDDNLFPLPIISISTKTSNENVEVDDIDESMSSPSNIEIEDDPTNQNDEDDQPHPVYKDTKDIIFYIEFVNGYTFKQFIEFIKRISKQMPLALSKKGISTVVCSSARQMIINSVFRREDLTCYEINEEYVNIKATSDSDWFHIINIDVNDLFDKIKVISKKDKICLIQYSKTPEKLVIQTSGQKNENTSTINVIKYTPVSYNITETNRRSTIYPNVTIQLSKFCINLTHLLKSKFTKFIFNVYNKGVVVVGTNLSGNSSKTIQFGIIGDTDEDSSKIIVSSSVIHSLIKLINFQNDGIIKIYCSSSALIRFETSIGSYGYTKIYIGSSKLEQKPSLQKSVNKQKKIEKKTNTTSTISMKIDDY